MIYNPITFLLNITTFTTLIYTISGKKYYISSTADTWEAGNDYCVTECDSTLATVHSESDQNKLLSNTDDIDETYLWIGLERDINSSSWVWVDFSSFDYTEPGVSLHYTSGYNCVALDTTNNKWIGLNCLSSYKYICNECISSSSSSIFANPAFLVPVFAVLMIIIGLISLYYHVKAKKRKKKKMNDYIASCKLKQKPFDQEKRSKVIDYTPKTKSLRGLLADNDIDDDDIAKAFGDQKQEEDDPKTDLKIQNNKSISGSSLNSAEEDNLDNVLDIVDDIMSEDSDSNNDKQ